MITSLHNKRIKDAVRLRGRRGRKSQQRIIIDGGQEVLRALQADVEILEMFFCDELLRPAARQALDLGQQRGLALSQVTREVFGKLAFGQRAEGVVAVAKTPATGWPDERLSEDALVVVLESVEKPGNLGGVVRTADAAGVDAVLVADPAVDLHSPNAIRASLGTIFTLPVLSAPGKEILGWLRAQRMAIFAARVDGAVEYSKVPYTGRSALVLGSEAHGLSPLWQGPDVTAVFLPMLGRADSLNVSVTAAVLVYEALRQRRK